MATVNLGGGAPGAESHGAGRCIIYRSYKKKNFLFLLKSNACIKKKKIKKNKNFRIFI
jgi:hypothetical protein